MNIPSPEKQLEFLSNIQLLLAEGQFVATYKFALLQALADICIEQGFDTGAELEIQSRTISEKFVIYYWPQARDYFGGAASGQGARLRFATGKPAAIVSRVREIQEEGFESVLRAKRGCRWKRLITKVDGVVREQPLWKLQTVGGRPLEFLYPNEPGARAILLKPGVMFCLRRFHGIVTDLTKAAWVLYVRRLNADLLGTPNDLDQFLFGSQRAALDAYAPVLREVQGGRCFYCDRALPANETPQVDHFIPWVRYPVDLGHNFVLADRRCNASKGDHLAAVAHLSKWTERNRTAGRALQEAFDRLGLLHDLEASRRIAYWAYARVAESGGLTWVRSAIFEPLGPGWERALG